MKITVEVKTTKTFEIDGDVYQYVKGLEGREAFEKAIEILAEWDDDYDTRSWDDSDKLELLEKHAGTVTWTHDVGSVSYEQRYRVYDYGTHKTLFRGNYEECAQYVTDGSWEGRQVDIVEA